MLLLWVVLNDWTVPLCMHWTHLMAVLGTWQAEEPHDTASCFSDFNVLEYGCYTLLRQLGWLVRSTVWCYYVKWLHGYAVISMAHMCWHHIYIKGTQIVNSQGNNVQCSAWLNNLTCQYIIMHLIMFKIQHTVDHCMVLNSLDWDWESYFSWGSFNSSHHPPTLYTSLSLLTPCTHIILPQHQSHKSSFTVHTYITLCSLHVTLHTSPTMHT